MREQLNRLANAVRLMVTRGKVVQATAGRRTTLQVTLLAGEVKNGVELLLPYGRSALPLAGDVLTLQVLGSRDHVVALCADDTSLRITDLQPGEFGDRDARGTQIVYRLDRLEITTPLKVVLNATNDVDVTAGGSVNITAATAVNLTAPSIVLAGGGAEVARVGDTVTCPAGTGHITTGSAKVTSG
jgi:phage gp45-like